MIRDWVDHWFGREALRWPRKEMTLRRGVRLEFKPADLWVGVFPKKNGPQLDVWICLVPMFPIHVRWFFRQRYLPVRTEDWEFDDDLNWSDDDPALVPESPEASSEGLRPFERDQDQQGGRQASLASGRD